MAKRRSKITAIDPVTGWRLYYPNKETTLYYVEFNDNGKLYYKIGITTKTVAQRFHRETIPYKVLWKRKYKSGRTAYINEQRILEKYSKFRCKNVYILHGGNTELFNKNVLKEQYE